MGKKSREKRKKREEKENSIAHARVKEKREPEPFLFNIILFGVYAILFTPLFLDTGAYFPFVGPKSLYFMGLIQIIFFLWLYLAINYKRYRPRLSTILVSFFLFLTVLFLSSIFGVDFSRSFWSKFERMTGFLMWLHLFGFFLVLSSVFRMKEWGKIFIISVSVATLIGICSLLGIAGIEPLQMSEKGAFTIGNTSFLGTYLLFNALIALWLFSQEKSRAWQSGFLVAIALMISATWLSGARAATLSFFGGLGLLTLLWLAFRVENNKVRIVGKLILFFSVIAVLVGLVLLFLPENALEHNIVRDKFIELTSRARFVNWEMATKGFLERPLLGWGPETYTLVFRKYFNPCLFIKECGGEVWFDRAHNIVFDTLVTTGLLGIITYLGIFLSYFFILTKKYFKSHSIDFWTFGILIVIPVAYFAQNLTVFDMATSLMMFVLVLSFVSFLNDRNKKRDNSDLIARHSWVAGLLAITFLFTFFQFVVRPYQADRLVISTVIEKNPDERLALYEKVLTTSAMGKYQLRTFMGQQTEEFIRNNAKTLSINDAKKELDIAISKLEKSIEESPLDLKTSLRLAYLYNIYGTGDPEKFDLAEKYGEMSIDLSPTNQQGYWVLAQTKLYKQEFDEALNLAQQAIDLEPRNFQAHEIALQIARGTQNQEAILRILKEALEINPEWQSRLNSILSNEKEATSSENQE